MSKELKSHSSARNNSLARLSYRPDIDGLRAIAVLAVVVFHAFPSLLKGGFVGVDIFFVISGYLITSIIINNFKDGNFSFFVFYARRIRRIFPTLIVVLIFSYIIAWVMLFPEDLRQFGLSVAAGAGFVSNFLLWSESGYFDASADAKPLLHLWSLGIEEQFYIIWPMLLWYFTKRKINLKLIILIIFVVSFVVNLSQVYSNRVAAFYSPLTRCWELLAGALLVFYGNNKDRDSGSDCNRFDLLLVKMCRWGLPCTNNEAVFRNALSLFGVLLIIISLFLVSKDSNFPGLWAVLPVFGAVCVINSGSNAVFNKFFLSNQFVVSIGLISYPLYLWHWPLLSFVKIIGAENSRLIRIATIVASFALAWLSYKFVESPLRFGKKENFKTISLILLIVLIGGVGALTWHFNGLIFGNNSQLKKMMHPLSTTMQNPNYESSDLFFAIWQGSPLLEQRDFLLFSGKSAESARIAVIGDSHANRLYLGLEGKSQLSMLNVGRGTCPPFIDVDVVDKNGNSFLCQPLVNNYLSYVKGCANIDIVVLNAFYIQYNRDVMLSYGSEPISFEKALAKTVEFFSDSNKTIVIVLDVPEVPRSCYSGKATRNWPVWNGEDDASCLVSRKVQDDLRKRVLNSLSHIKYNQYSVYVFDPASVLCKYESCGEIDEKNYLYYKDGNHLNAMGVHLVGSGCLKNYKQYVISLKNRGTFDMD